MDNIIEGVSNFQGNVFPGQKAIYQRLVRDGQKPKALIIACADSRVSPEHITRAEPGELFVCRNAGNIVPPYSQANGGVSSAIEYAVVALGVRDIVVCGHSDCGAMKGLCDPAALDAMPNVAAWLRHSHAASQIVCEAYPQDLSAKDRTHALALENVVVQLNLLRTHPSVAASIAKGELRLHGWFFAIETDAILTYDTVQGVFAPIGDEPGAGRPPVVPPTLRVAAPEIARSRPRTRAAG
ncbi:carbonic anhydrase [Methylobacterium sp. BTF04]|uniref:carbonic anhydrase n=1 Tax=Methylobacterium sp. BTF04 TaxID=2708300 RepID=UPI0013D2750B|nr:carbonic anhydrase [Methylobacterium sp. BTF04]